MLLASSMGYVRNTDNDQGWYLAQYANINHLLVDNYNPVGTSAAQLLNNQPDTNQATTTTTTVSESASLTGDVGVDKDGASAGVSTGISWSTSNTFSKANVGIQNISLSATGNDASWTFTPNPSDRVDDSCINTISAPADLSRATFSPSQAFI